MNRHWLPIYKVTTLSLSYSVLDSASQSRGVARLRVRPDISADTDCSGDTKRHPAVLGPCPTSALGSFSSKRISGRLLSPPKWSKGPSKRRRSPFVLLHPLGNRHDRAHRPDMNDILPLQALHSAGLNTDYAHRRPVRLMRVSVKPYPALRAEVAVLLVSTIGGDRE